jgi:predicted lipid-binding transport protein (Tim44 family)
MTNSRLKFTIAGFFAIATLIVTMGSRSAWGADPKAPPATTTAAKPAAAPGAAPAAIPGAPGAPAQTGAPAADAAPKVKVERGAGGKKVYRITEEIRIEGKIQKPEAFFFYQKSSINYDWQELKQDFVPKILDSVSRAPF